MDMIHIQIVNHAQNSVTDSYKKSFLNEKNVQVSTARAGNVKGWPSRLCFMYIIE